MTSYISFERSQFLFSWDWRRASNRYNILQKWKVPQFVGLWLSAKLILNSLISNRWAKWGNLCLPGLVKKGFHLSTDWITWAKEYNLVVHLSDSQNLIVKKICPFISALNWTFSFWIKVFNQIIKFSTYLIM